MSQENVEIVRDIYEELMRGNEVAFRDRLDPEVLYWLRADDPEPGPYEGRDAAMEWIAHPPGFVEVHTQAHAIVDAGDFVVASVHTSGRGATSGAPYDVEGAIVHRFEAGRIVEMREFADRGEALAAVGLSE
jgi:ketosteroid isomerase-like protein